MRAISSIAVLFFAPAFAAAAPPPASAGAGAAPAETAHPPLPAELAPLNPDFQAAMASSQLQTYRYTQLTEQALALKKLCETGFGPTDICPRGVAAAGPAGGGGAALPTIAAIDGAGGALSAVLVLADGRRLAVRPGSALPGGLTVSGITGDGVRVRTAPGREARLDFQLGPGR